MSKARLIKHREWLEREQAAQRQARLSPVAQVKVDAVRDWVKRQQASQLIEDILKKEEEHADDLSNMLETFDPEKAPALIGESYHV